MASALSSGTDSLPRSVSMCRSRPGPTYVNASPKLPSAIAAWHAPPDETMASQLSRGACMRSNNRSTECAGRGAFVSSTTVPPPIRNRRQASAAAG